ncbi:MAG: outer membrane protein assembly factor BamA [Xanthobacteraceae bacterium]
MPRRLAAAALFASILTVCALAAGGPAGAQTAAAAIAVAGNRHVDAAMIRSYVRLAPGRRLDDAALDAALKRLYATGLFADVKMARDGDRVLVRVVENPTIERIAFEGNKKIKDADLTKALQSKAGGPLARFFVQADVVHLIELYRQRGYFQVQIIPETIKLADRAGGAKGNGKNVAGDTRRGGAAARNHKGELVDLVFHINEGEKLAVRKIRFVGNRAFASYKLTGVIKSGKTNFLSFLLDNDIYNADKIANDCDLLRQFYRAHGYADAQVRSSANFEANLQGVTLTYSIDEGPLYRYGTVEIRSQIKDVDPASLRRYLRTHSGDVYDAGAVNKTVDNLTMQLARSGEPFADVLVEPDREPPPRAGGTGAINLRYTIAGGKRLYVEEIEIHGNTKTRDSVIRREFDFGEGDAYNQALVDRAKRRLKALGYFKSVKFSTHPGSAPDRVALNVDVVEQDTGNFFITGGYSTMTGIMAGVTVSNRNLLGTGDSGKISVTYGQYARGLDVAFTDPYFLDQRLSAGVELFGNETFGNVNQSYNSSVYGAKFSLGMPLTEQLGVTWDYSIYNQAVSLDPTEGTSSLPIQQAAAAGPIWVSSIGGTLTYSTLDNPKSPTSGLQVQTSNELAGLGGSADFAKTTEDIHYYQPVVGDVVGMVRAQGGYVAPWGGQQLPLLDNFFGGPQLVRGFAPNGFGPRDITPGTDMDNVGGNIYWTSSAELEAPVPGVPADANLKAALFSDVGSLWASGTSATSLAALSPSQQIANSRALRASIGTALIWDSPFGALQVDYAYPIAKQPYDVTQRLNFTAGAF